MELLMSHRIDYAALSDFVQREAAELEATQTTLSSSDLPFEANELTTDDVRAIWLGVGIATRIGRSLMDAPERFVTPRPVAVR
jgi:hypothetical protein